MITPLHLEIHSSFGFQVAPSLLVSSPLLTTPPIFFSSSSFSDAYTLDWSIAQFLEYESTSWAVALNPTCILESRGELLKDADALAPLHSKWIRSSGVYTQSDIAHPTPFAQKFLLQVPKCWNWEPKSRGSHPLNILYPDDSQNISGCRAFLSPPNSSIQPLRTTMGISSPTCSNRTLFFPSLLMVNPYFQPHRPNNLESSLIPVFLSQWNIMLQEILLCLQNTSVYNNISPLPPLPPWSNPIVSHLNYCKSHISRPRFFGHRVPGVYSAQKVGDT